MSSYKIFPYSYRQAQALGVQIAPSQDPKKKIDVFKDGKLIASIGAMGYKDFPTYTQTEGEFFANERRRLYKIRHQRTRTVVGSPSFYADNILW